MGNIHTVDRMTATHQTFLHMLEAELGSAHTD